MYERDNYICQYCGKHVIGLQPQRAHVIGNTKLARKMFGDDVVDSVHNWKTACSLSCNAKLDIGIKANPVEAEAWAERVRRLENERLDKYRR